MILNDIEKPNLLKKIYEIDVTPANEEKQRMSEQGKGSGTVDFYFALFTSPHLVLPVENTLFVIH